MYIKMDLCDFQPWGQAREIWDRINDEDKYDDFERLLDDCYPEGLTETELNDLLAYDWEWVYEQLGVEDEEEDEEEEDE